MKSAVCTLFEGHYHFGVATLVNSLYVQGFRGDFYAGYRGGLPVWAKSAQPNTLKDLTACHTIEITNELRVHFISLETNYHFTNYKPDFMLKLLDGPASDVDSIYYFDPDIVVSAPWSFFERWVKCGVALCEDVNSPLSKNHPTRIAWRNYFAEIGIKLNFKDAIYVNGGFVGAYKQNRGFIETWKKVQEGMAPIIGGLNRSAFTTGAQLPEEARGPFAPFGKTDQDALNVTIEAWEGEVSFITQEGMGFRPGLTIMPHALGQPKPWKWKIFKQLFAGRSPRMVDREYWKYTVGPLQAHSNAVVKRKKIVLGLATLFGRFYRR